MRDRKTHRHAGETFQETFHESISEVDAIRKKATMIAFPGLKSENS
jgi:hypothetical protein